jgi:hypothetical protein
MRTLLACPKKRGVMSLAHAEIPHASDGHRQRVVRRFMYRRTLEQHRQRWRRFHEALEVHHHRYGAVGGL